MNLRSLKYLAVAAFLAPLCAQAADYTVASDRILSDPLYLPLQGQFYGDTSYQWATTSRDVFDAAGVKVASERINSNPLAQSFEYGITDDLTVAAGIGYNPSATSHISPVGGTNVDRTSEGWTDPTFGIVYRALDQRSYPVTLDFGAAYSPNVFSSTTASDIEDGTVARGGQEWDLGATLGREMRYFTIAGTFGAQYLGSRGALNEASGDNIGTSSTWIYSLGLATQFRFTDCECFSVNAGAGYTFGHDEDVLNETTLVEHENSTKGTPNLNVALNYHFIPNVVVGSLTYQHNFSGGSDNTYAAVPADNSSVSNKSEDLLGVKLRYTFQ